MVNKSSVAIISAAAATAILVIAIIMLNVAAPPPTGNKEETDAKQTPPPTTTAVPPSNKPSEITSVSSPYIKEYDLPRKEIWPNGITVDTDKTVWFIGTRSNSLFSFDASTDKFEEFKLPTKSSPSTIMGWGVATDKQGKVWFTDDSAGSIWEFDPSTREFKRIELGAKSQGNSLPTLPIQIAVDDRTGYVWFTELYGDKVGFIPPGSDSAQELPTPTSSSGPSGIFIKDRYVWFTEALVNKIARYSYDDGKIVEFTPLKQLNSPVGLFVDKDGNAWVTEHGSSFIARYNIANDTVFMLATSRQGGQIITLPYWIRSDANDNVWFTEHAGNRLAMFNTTDYTLTEYEIPTRGTSGLSNTMSLSISPGDSVWFAEWTEDKIGVVDPTVPLPFTIGASTDELEIPKGGSADVFITVGATNNNVTTLVFKSSGTETPSGRLFNITATFNPENARLPTTTNLGENTITTKLTIKTDPSIKPGEYTITAGASDGFVTKSVIIRLYVK